MKYALIAPNEVSGEGYRIAQVEAQSFEVALPLYWKKCEDTVTTNYWFNPNTESFVALPVSPVITPQDVQGATNI